MTWGKRSVIVAALVWTGGCSSESGSTPSAPIASPGAVVEKPEGPAATCANAGYPAVPADATIVRFVAPCTTPDATAPLGSAAHPYPTILASLDGLGPRTTIVIAPGTYDGSIRLTQEGTRLWGSNGERGEDAAVVVREVNATGPLVSMTDVANVVVHGLRIEDAPGVAIAIQGGSATVRGSSLLRPKQHGISANDAAIIFQNVVVEGAGSVGIIFQNVSGIIFQNTVRGAAMAGLVASGPKLGDLSIRDNRLLGNTRLGLGAYGLEGVTIEGNTVNDTAAHATLGGGDGIMVGDLGSPAIVGNVELRKNIVERSARTGIIFQNQPNAIIFQNQVRKSGAGAIRASVASSVGDNDVVRFDGNVLEENAGFGIAALGGRAIIFQNQIRTTSLTDFGLAKGNVGDGIALVSAIAGQRIEGNEISGSARVGMLFDGLHKSAVIATNTMAQNVLDVYLQNTTVTKTTMAQNAPNTTIETSSGNGANGGPPYYFPDDLPATTDPLQ